MATVINISQIQQLGTSITGKVVNTSTGTVQLEILTLTELTNQVPIIDWGSGFVSGATNCTLDSDGTFGLGCQSFTTVNDGFLLENTGNTNLSVNFTSNKNATTFINGTNPEFQYKVSPNSIEGQSGENSTLDSVVSCENNWSTSVYLDINNSGSVICGNSTFFPLSFQATKDAAVFDVRVVIPEDAPQGPKTATLTFFGTSSA